ncbi:MAG: hypothetical protein P4M13_09005, partial [Alphaproteobacteria bacterium]|nr:hypothetical protein [Alphaproteobacteria bacterium]
ALAANGFLHPAFPTSFHPQPRQPIDLNAKRKQKKKKIALAKSATRDHHLFRFAFIFSSLPHNLSKKEKRASRDPAETRGGMQPACWGLRRYPTVVRLWARRRNKRVLSNVGVL